MFERIGLIGRREDPRVGETLVELSALLCARGKDVTVDEVFRDELRNAQVTFADIDTLGQQVQLAIIVGGDGTFLGAARSLVGQDLHVVGINLGRLGFLTDMRPEHLAQSVDQILAGSYSEERRFLLNAQVQRGNKVIYASNIQKCLLLAGKRCIWQIFRSCG